MLIGALAILLFLGGCKFSVITDDGRTSEVVLQPAEARHWLGRTDALSLRLAREALRLNDRVLYQMAVELREAQFQLMRQIGRGKVQSAALRTLELKVEAFEMQLERRLTTTPGLQTRYQALIRVFDQLKEAVHLLLSAISAKT